MLLRLGTVVFGAFLLLNNSEGLILLFFLHGETFFPENFSSVAKGSPLVILIFCTQLDDKNVIIYTFKTIRIFDIISEVNCVSLKWQSRIEKTRSHVTQHAISVTSANLVARNEIFWKF